MAQRRPNIVILYTDQQRYETLGCTNDNCPIETPNIDEIAKTGRVFENCYVQAPTCAPSRVSFLSGRYPTSLRIGENGMTVPDDVDTIANIVKDYGYQTANIGKLHFQPHCNRIHKDKPKNYGFDFFELSDEPGCYDDAYTAWVEMVAPEKLPGVRVGLPPISAVRARAPKYSDHERGTAAGYITDGDCRYSHEGFVAQESVRYIEERDKNKPFLMISGFYAPHPPLNPSQECFDSVDRDKLPLPFIEEWRELHPELTGFGEEDFKTMAQYYYAMVKHVDDCVGPIIKSLKDEGIYDDTIIVFTSDHGEYLGDHGLVQKGMPGYDCITHIPMLVSYPAKMEHGRTSALIESVDIIPTLLKWCGIQVPTNMQGKPLQDLIEGKVDKIRETSMTEMFRWHGNKEIRLRAEHWSYYKNTNGQELLFALDEDPHELINRAADPAYSEGLAFMRNQALQRMMEAANCSLDMEAEY